MDRRKKTGRLALLGVLAAQALVLGALENLFPPLPGLPPGAKLGLSNIVTMFTASALGLWPALGIALLKALFAGISRGPVALLMSGSGGLCSTLLMVFLLRRKRCPFGLLGISVLAALAHNGAQLAVACLLSGTPALALSYGPLLLPAAVGSGILTGVLLKAVLPVLNKQKGSFLQ